MIPLIKAFLFKYLFLLLYLAFIPGATALKVELVSKHYSA